MANVRLLSKLVVADKLPVSSLIINIGNDQRTFTVT